MHKLILESFITVQEGRRITGLALTPRISLNHNFYMPAELERADGISVPLNLEHDTSKVPIGQVTFHYDKELMQLRYEGYVIDPQIADSLKHKTMHVSIGADVNEVGSVCDQKTCYDVPKGLIFRELSLVESPGIPESTVTIIESTTWKHKCVNESLNTSNISKAEQKEIMTDSTEQTKPTEEVKKSEMTCPEGQTMKDGKCVPAGESKKEDCGCSKKETEKSEEKTWIPNMDEINARFKEQKIMIDEAKERINKMTQVDELTAWMKAEKEAKQRSDQIATLSPEGMGFKSDDVKMLAEHVLPKLKRDGYASWNIDLAPEHVARLTGKISEAVSFSGTQSELVSAGDPVFILPGGKYIRSIRDLVRFKEIPTGADTIKFFKGDIPNNVTITEGSATTAGTHTLTTVTLTADTVTGVAQEIKYADIEDSPFELMSYLNETARAEVLEAEATLVFSTAAAAATPLRWINANSGATITHTDIASMTMEPVSLAVALQNLDVEGYDTSFGNAYCMLHPKALRELRLSTNLTTYVQQGDATITKTGQLTHLFGIELRPTTALDVDDNTTNDVYNNVVGIKKHTFALASHRELLIEMLRVPNKAMIDWTWSQRKNATAFDASSFIRISSAQ